MDPERLQYLLDRHFDDSLTAAERAELSQALLESHKARDAFWEQAKTNAALREWGKQSWGDLEPEAIPAPPRIHRIWWRVALGAAALVIAGIFLAQRLHQPANPLTGNDPKDDSTSDEIDDATTDGVAVLTKTTNVVWQDDAKSLTAGMVLPPGWLKFKSGAIQIEFSRGARIVLEGPAELNLVSNNEAFLQSGRLRANVPEPAHGFKITSPEFALVDHGTEFGCMVGAAGQSEVHVFTGEVDVQPAARADSLCSLHKAEAVRVNPQQLTSITARPDLFLTEEGLSRRESERATKELDTWRKSNQETPRAPGALLHLDFEHHGEWERNVPNRVLHEEEAVGASIVESWAEGRWPGKGALEFKSTSDRIRLSLPGNHKSLTLMTWVRIDRMQLKQHALLMGEGQRPGELHWYIYKGGSLGLGIRVGEDQTTNDGQWRNFHSRPVIPTTPTSAWMFLATVFDGETNRVTHYVNGESSGTTVLGVHLRLLLEDCEIGNWGVNLNDPKWKTISGFSPTRRNFRGAMDEFTILSTPLDAQEIHRRYEQGRPHESGQSAVN